jgi:hypothetical protein
MTSFSTVTITLHADDSSPMNVDEEDENFIARIFGDSWDSASGVIEGILAGTITIGIIGLAVLPFALIFYVMMTPLERERPKVINGSRRKRIARGSGTTVQDVNRLLRQFEQAQQMMKRLGGMRGKIPMGIR